MNHTQTTTRTIPMTMEPAYALSGLKEYALRSVQHSHAGRFAEAKHDAETAWGFAGWVGDGIEHAVFRLAWAVVKGEMPRADYLGATLPMLQQLAKTL